MRSLFAGVALAALLSSAAFAQTIGPAPSSGGGTPGGSSGQVQYNNGGAFGGITTTGSGNVVLSTSPTLVTPVLGTPASGVATNLTGTAAGLTAGTVTTDANLTGVITSSGNATSIASQTGTGTKFVVDNGPTLIAPLLGTPASGVATNLTGTAAGLTAGNVTTNANLTGVITSSGNATSIASQTGTGTKFVVDNGPTLIAPVLGAATATTINGVTIPSVTDTAAVLGTAQTFTAAQTISRAGAASVSPLLFTGVILSGGTGTTNFPHLFIQPTAATASTGWSTGGTAIGVNLDIAAGNFLDFQQDGSAIFKIDNVGIVTMSNSNQASLVMTGGLQLGLAKQFQWGSSRAILTSPGAANLQFGGADAASPVAQTLSFQSVIAGTSNTAGAAALITGSKGTGTGVGGAVSVQTAPASTTGSTQNVLVTVQKWDGLVHVSYGGTAPALSSCGGSPTIDAHATDTSGTVTAGSATATCTITFNKAYATWDHCRISAQSSLASFAYSYSLSAIVVTATSLTGNLDYTCDGS